MLKRTTRKLPQGKLFSVVTHFWDQYFPNDQEVTLQQFLDKFKLYIKQTADHDLTEDQILNIRNIIDPKMTGTVCLLEYYIFFHNFWNEIHERRKLLKGIIPFSVIWKEDPMSFKQITFTIEATPRHSFIKKGDTFQTFEIDLNQLPKQQKYDWTFGKSGCDCVLFRDSDPYYPNELFRISKTPENFFIKCTSGLRQLSLKIGKRPVYLIPGMIIRFGVENLYQITYINPIPYEPDPKIVTMLSMFKGEFYDQLIDKEFKSIGDIKPLFSQYVTERFEEAESGQLRLRLECIKGPSKGDIVDFHYKVMTGGLRYDIGRAQSRVDYYINDITVSNIHASIGFVKSGWYIYEEEPTPFGTHIYLADQYQFQHGGSSASHILEDGMEFSVDEYVFSCKIKPVTKPGAEELQQRYLESKSRMLIQNESSTQT